MEVILRTNSGGLWTSQTQNVSEDSRRKQQVSETWSAYILLALVVTAFLVPWTRLFSLNGDEAISLEGARRVLEGQLPARDFFEAIGPGEFYWQALFFKLFGTNIAVSRGLLLITGVMFALILYHLSQRIKGSATLCVGIFTVAGFARFPLTSYHWDADLSALIAFALFIEWQRTLRLPILLLSAGFAGATTLIMQQKGLFMAAAIFLSAWLVKRTLPKRTIISFAAVYLAPLAGMICFYLVQGAIGNLLWANFLWPAGHYLSLNGCPYGMSTVTQYRGIASALRQFVEASVASVLADFVSAPLWIIVLLPGLLLSLALLLRKRAFSAELLPFWLCGAALWFSEFQRPDYSHLVWGCPIWLLLFTALLRNRLLRRIVVPTLIVSCAFLGLIEFVVASGPQVKVEGRNGTLYDYRPNDALQFLEQNTKPHENVFVYPYYAMYNFLSDTDNPTRYTYMFHGMHTPEQFQEVVHDLEATQTRLVLWDTSFRTEVWQRLFPAYKEPQSKDLIVENYLSAHYHEIALKSGFRVMELNQRQSAGQGSVASQP